VATAPRGAAPAQVEGPREPAAEGVEQELPLIRGAQEALRAGDLDGALRLLDAHARRFPAGALAEERRAAHAIAVCRKSGVGAGARAEAEAFVREVPSSPLVERVGAACGLGPR
jgi:hypothetical protein